MPAGAALISTNQGTGTEAGVMASQDPPPALAGVTVLELGARIGASVAGSLLAQLGAEVVFVEAAGHGGFPQTKWSCRDQLAAGKQSLVVNAADGGDRALLAQLADRSDVVLLSSDIDALAHGGALLAARPASCIVADVTAFGATGPLTGRPATDAEVQALTGVMDATGVADGPPTAIALPLIEQLAGVYAAAGVLASLHSGAALPVDVALYDVAFSAMTSFLAPALTEPDRVEASRVGNRHTMAAPWNVYQANDGWLLLCAGNDEQWNRISALIGANDERLARNADRVAHADVVDRLVQDWVQQRSIAESVQRLSALGIPCGPVATIERYPHEANLEHRRMVRRAATPDGREIFLPASPLRMSRTPGAALLRIPAPDADRTSIEASVIPAQAGTQDGGSSIIPAQAGTQDGASSVIPAKAGTQNGVRLDEGKDGRPPLAGVRVVEIGHYTTAPVATRLLAALGADVIKIEPPEGEAVRHWPPARGGQGLFFTFQNADKRSLVLDLNSPQGVTTLQRLLAGADVLVENLRPGALARKGLAPDQLRQLNPRLVYCAISGFGADSLYEGRAAFDTVIQAMSGMMAINRIGDMPLKTGPSLADVTGAAMGMLAVLAALEERARSGTGQAIDLSMQDICAWAIQAAWNDASLAMPGNVVQCDGGPVFTAPGRDEVRVLATREVVRQPQTEARRLWAMVAAHGTEFPVLASPLRVGAGAMAVPRPGPSLGADTETILKTLA